MTMPWDPHRHTEASRPDADGDWLCSVCGLCMRGPAAREAKAFSRVFGAALGNEACAEYPAIRILEKDFPLKRAAGRDTSPTASPGKTEPDESGDSHDSGPAAAKSAARHSPAETTECGT